MINEVEPEDDEIYRLAREFFKSLQKELDSFEIREIEVLVNNDGRNIS